MQINSESLSWQQIPSTNLTVCYGNDACIDDLTCEQWLFSIANGLIPGETYPAGVVSMVMTTSQAITAPRCK